MYVKVFIIDAYIPTSLVIIIYSLKQQIELTEVKNLVHSLELLAKQQFSSTNLNSIKLKHIQSLVTMAKTAIPISGFELTENKRLAIIGITDYNSDSHWMIWTTHNHLCHWLQQRFLLATHNHWHHRLQQRFLLATHNHWHHWPHQWFLLATHNHWHHRLQQRFLLATHNHWHHRLQQRFLLATHNHWHHWLQQRFPLATHNHWHHWPHQWFPLATHNHWHHRLQQRFL